MVFILSGIFAIIVYSRIFPIKYNKITGSFCEFRESHLHTGIDISTNQLMNIPVIAPEDGYISYIKQDFTGYGKALFLNTSDYIYVFAHLNGFNNKITSLLNKNKFRQTLYLPPNTINIKRGDTIAFTGRSGTLYPHLHFEMRSKNNYPLNPLLYFSIADNEYPIFKGLIIEPADDSSLIEGRHEIIYFKAKKYSKSYYSIGNVNLNGTFYIYPLIIDKKNSLSARLFIYRLYIYSSKKLLFSFQNDSTSFYFSSISPKLFKGKYKVKDNNYIFNPHINTDYWNIKNKCRALYSNIDTIIAIIAQDIKGNKSTLTIRINNTKDSKLPIKTYKKIAFVNNKLCIIYSNSISADSIFGFKLYKNKNYLYYVYNTNKNIYGPIKTDKMKINESFIYIDKDKPFNIDNITIYSQYSINTLFSKKNIKLKYFISKSPLYEFSLNNNFYNSIKYVIQNYEGYSFYLHNNDKYRFIKKLKAIDTINTHYIHSFIIGRDTENPTYRFIKKIKHASYTKYIYKLYDNISGIDWNFVCDSNKLYNIPDPYKKEIEIIGNKGDIFIIKDREGNKTYIKLP